MTGLENILAQIENESKLRADSIINEAKSASESIIAEAKKAAEDIICDFRQRAENNANEVINRAQAADEIEGKRAELRKKQELINKAIDTAKAEIKAMNADSYFVFMAKVFKKYALEKSGKLLLAQGDILSMTDSVKRLLADWNIEAQSGEMPEHGGFVIVYGSIEINCTIDAIFDEKSEEISDALNKFLFGREGGI